MNITFRPDEMGNPSHLSLVLYQEVEPMDLERWERMKRVYQAAPKMYEMLERLEWAIDDYNDDGSGKNRECPTCGAYFIDGHKSDCDLAALLRRIEGEE